MQTRLLIGLLAVAAPFAAVPTAWADGSGDPTAVKSEDGKYSDKDGNQTYKIQSDGTVDWFKVKLPHVFMERRSGKGKRLNERDCEFRS